MPRSVADEIESLSAKRRAAWAAGDAQTASRLSGQLEALYAEKRRAAAPHGSPAAHKRAVKRAIIERDIDRLMQS